MRVLIIGLGSIAKKHISALSEIYPDVDLYSFRSSHTFSDIKKVVNIYELNDVKRLGIDFAIVSNPTFKHKEAIESLLEFDLPLFIEKPLFNFLGEDNLLRVIGEKKIPTYVACNLRFLECIKFIKSAIIAKRINEVNIYCGSFLPDWKPTSSFKESYSANSKMGGGVHLDLIHEFDYAYWIFGKPMNVRRYTSSNSSLEINAVDYANYLLQFQQYNINVVLNYFRRDSKRTLEVVCDDGTFNVDLLKNEAFWNGEQVFKTKQLISDTYIEQMRFFTENILTKKSSFNSVNEAYEILKICLATE